jgi:predicted TIM-barrel fold metal-dependent hydrolase
MDIVDAHHHFWDPQSNYHPWLCDSPPIPFRYGDYSSICKPFMADDYDRVAANWNVIASVTMEGEWDPGDAIGEARWIRDLIKTSGRPAAHVAQAWLDQPDLPGLLEQLSELEIVRSVRHKPMSTARPGEGSGGMSQASFIDGFKQLAHAGFHFDLQTPWWHLHEVRHLVNQSDDTLIIVNHTGLPSDRSESGFKSWYAAMRALSAVEQVRVKISGLGTDMPWTVDANREIVLSTIALFGVDRCMFASNFPVDGLCASFDTIFSGFDEITRDFSADERHALFCQTAVDTYALTGLQDLDG